MESELSAHCLPADLLIGGTAGRLRRGRFDVLDPATGDVIAAVADGTVDDALAAVDAAAAAGRGLGGDAAAPARGDPAPGLRADDRARRRARRS